MIQSMTGYGKKEKRIGEYLISIDLQVCNSRFLEITLRLPDILLPYEEEFKRQIADCLARGRVRGTIALNSTEQKAPRLQLNTALLRQYYEQLLSIARELKLRPQIALTDLLALPDLFLAEPSDDVASPLIDDVKVVLEETLAEVVNMRQREGAFLVNDIRNHLAIIEQKTTEIEQLSLANRDANFSRLQSYLQELCGELNFDQNRILQEAALLIKKLDITEECERLRSHINQFQVFLGIPEPVGKKLNFLIQEMNREVTTMGTKAENAPISHLVVDLKDELEKIREQIQNIL